MQQHKVALVTGGNRGIGFEICRQLAALDYKVILTARDKDKGVEAARRLNQEGSEVVFHPLQVTDIESIEAVKGFIETKFKRLDVIVNNAGILLDRKSSGLTVEAGVVRNTIETNTLAPLFLCQQLIPIMQKQKFGRIVNMSSGLGALHEMAGGYPAYRISKTALNAVTAMLAGELQGENILVNSMCPGWVRTDMGGSDASRSVGEGAETAVWLSMLPDGGPSGGFFRDKEQIEW